LVPLQMQQECDYDVRSGSPRGMAIALATRQKSPQKAQKADGIIAHEGAKALSRLHDVANAPIFSHADAFFGRDLVGGRCTL
jgi:hypothetical protein